MSFTIPGVAPPLAGTVGIIPCTNQKSDTPGPAREVWIGAHFQLVLAHAELFYERVYVMSYKYGFIEPDFHIEPYDVDMKTAKAADRIRWWFMMRHHIKQLAETKPLLVALYTGTYERDRIMREFVKHGTNQIVLPFEGMSIGQRQAAVYDCEDPYDKEKALAGGYALPDSFAEPAAASGQKYQPPPTNMTDDIEWE